MQNTLAETFNRARAVGTPLVFITSPDAAATMAAVIEEVNLGYDALNEAPPMLLWDTVQGVTPCNEQHAGSLTLCGMLGEDCGVGNPVEILKEASRLPDDTILFMHNLHLFLDSPMVIQAIWNLRDPFKATGRMLVGLVPSVTLPAELNNDVLLLDEPLPDAQAIGGIVVQQYEQAREMCSKLPPISDEELARAIDATIGLPAFPAEQAVAMSLTRGGLNTVGLWEKKRALVEQTPGLSVYRGHESFSDIAGCRNVKEFVARLIDKSHKQHGTPVRCVLWLDEIEKMFAGLGGDGFAGDSNGLQQDKLGQLLKWMEDTKARAMLFIGFPGTGKSLVAKATGTYAGVPTVEADLGAMSGSLVGQSEALVRQFLKTVDAMAPRADNGQSGVLVIATCNGVGQMPPELLSRFRRGQFFFDLPDAEERAAMWSLHCLKNGLPDSENNGGLGFNDDGWTGREIEACCAIAADLDLPLVEACKYVVPASRTMGERATQLRKWAEGRFLSASYEGVFKSEADKPAVKTGRRITLKEEKVS